MNDKFFDLKKEKQDKIINSAIKLFSIHGYRRASTDDMVKEAEISKGLLFHYFTSKQGLYEFILDYCIRYMTLEYSHFVNTKETDYFQILRQLAFVKMQVMKQYPYLPFFLSQARFEQDEDIEERTKETMSSYQESFEFMFQHVDNAFFKEDLDLDRIRKMVEFTLDSLMMEAVREGLLDNEGLYRNILSYINLFRSISYKDELR